MTAGSIAVPTVIPLRPPLLGRSKTSIDSNTKIELKTETAGADIYYTINGWKPDPFQKTGDRFTMKYLGPFTLPAGKQTVKAVAVSSDGLRESNVVTKIFEVDFVPTASLPVEDDEHHFEDDLNRSRAKREINRARAKLIPRPGSAWTKVDVKTSQQQMADMEIKEATKHRPNSSIRFSEEKSNSGQTSQEMYSNSIPQPYIFNGIGSQDLRWAIQSQLTQPHDSPTKLHFDQSRYPRAVDFLNFTSGGQYPGGSQWLPPNVSPFGYNMPPGQSTSGVSDGSLKSRKLTHNVSTQTVGLFYPSQKQIDITKEQVVEKLALVKQMSDRRPLLTAVSPGRGYWRKQIDHICQHLKVHTQNNAEFRAMIGEPKMGKLLTSSVQEDEYELTLTLTFALRNNKHSVLGKQLGVSKSEEYLSGRVRQDDQMYSEDSESEEEEEEEIITSRSAGVRVKKVRKPKAKKKTGPKLSPVNTKLFKLLGSKSDISVSDIQQLLDEDADPNCLNKNDVSPLILAVRNQHVDAVEVLVHGGADINAKGPSSLRGNTALHEAVNLGPSGMKVLDALLHAGADQNLKNDKGETPHDLAVKSGFEAISKRLASALGQSQLEKMTKPRSY